MLKKIAEEDEKETPGAARLMNSILQSAPMKHSRLRPTHSLPILILPFPPPSHTPYPLQTREEILLSVRFYFTLEFLTRVFSKNLLILSLQRKVHRPATPHSTARPCSAHLRSPGYSRGEG